VLLQTALRPKRQLEGRDMDSETLIAKTPATREEIKRRVGFALERHPRCRDIDFDIISMPRSSKGGNWTISLHAISPDAVWEVSDVVADVQEAYELVVA
jgi:hypothetical protein